MLPSKDIVSRYEDNALVFREFPVRVYRKTEQQGWQKMISKKSNGRIVTIKAEPKQGCILLRRIQVRVRLSSSITATVADVTVSSNASLATKQIGTKKQQSNDGKKRSMGGTSVANNVLIIRRRNYILISSRLRLRSLVLKFTDMKSCLQFCDQLVQLNSSQVVTSHTSLVNRQHPFSYNSSIHIRAHASTDAKETRDVLSCVGRLLYDEDFLTFCDSLESYIFSSEDGRDILNTLSAQSRHNI